MAIYVPIHPVPLQFMDGNGDPLESGTLEFYQAGTSTPVNLYSDSSGTSIGSSITLNSQGYPESGGNIITLFRDTTVDYKIIAKNAAAATIWTADELSSELDVLATNNNGEGASLIGIEDAAGNFTATDVEGALAEVYSDLASTSNGLGASLVGVEDAGGHLSATDAEAAIAEIASPDWEGRKVKTGSETRISDTALADDSHFAGWSLVAGKLYSIEAFLDVSQDGGDLKFRFQFSNAPQQTSMLIYSQDETGTEHNDFSVDITATKAITSMTDTDRYGLRLVGQLSANATTGGTLDFQWAQNGSDPDATTLFFGSWMKIRLLD